jgi:hypothetical protein
MQAMVAALGPEAGRLAAARDWHYGRVLQHPMTQPDQVLATFVADDNDGNLTNGTPNYSGSRKSEFRSQSEEAATRSSASC